MVPDFIVSIVEFLYSLYPEEEDRKKLLLFAGGILAFMGFILFSQAVKATQTIWIMTRAFGILSFIALFLAVILGELRLLSKVKGEFTLFRFHKPLAIFSLSLVVLHFITAISDNFKWGKTYSLVNYLGLTFSNKWLVFLSFGSIAFYLMILIAITSAKKSQMFIGYKRWNVTHYLSYLCFFIAYIHSINLGTDIRHSSVSVFLFPLFLLMFTLATSLLIVRLVKSLGIFKAQWEINLTSIILVTLAVGAVFFVNITNSKENAFELVKTKVDNMHNEIQGYEAKLQNLTVATNTLKETIGVNGNG